MITLTENQMLVLHKKAHGYFNLLDKNIVAEKTFKIDDYAITLHYDGIATKVFVTDGTLKVWSQKPVYKTPRLTMAETLNKLLYYEG